MVSDDKCTAILCHGPGHQSETHCRLRGEHDIHETYYGRYRQFMQWRGQEGFTGFFDEPEELPPVPKRKSR